MSNAKNAQTTWQKLDSQSTRNVEFHVDDNYAYFRVNLNANTYHAKSCTTMLCGMYGNVPGTSTRVTLSMYPIVKKAAVLDENAALKAKIAALEAKLAK